MVKSFFSFCFFIVCICVCVSFFDDKSVKFVSAAPAFLTINLGWAGGPWGFTAQEGYAYALDTECNDTPTVSTLMTTYSENQGNQQRFWCYNDNSGWRGNYHYTISHAGYLDPNRQKTAYQTELYIPRSSQFGPIIAEMFFQGPDAFIDRYNIFSYNKNGGYLTYAQPGRFAGIRLDADMYDNWLTVQLTLDADGFNRCSFALGITGQNWRYVDRFDCPWLEGGYPFDRTVNRYFSFWTVAGAASSSWTNTGNCNPNTIYDQNAIQVYLRNLVSYPF